MSAFSPAFSIPMTEDFERCVEAVVQTTGQEIDGSDPISQALHRAVLNQRPSALHVPGVKMAIDVTLDVMASIEQSLPTEVFARTLEGRYIAKDAMTLLVMRRANENHFLGNSRLNTHPLLAIHQEFFRDPEELSTLAGAPFSDAGRVSGGVLALLEKEGFDDEPAAEVVARSTSLQVVGRMDKNYAPGATTELGYPYVDIDRLQLIEGGAGVEAIFTPDTLAYIRSKFSKGGGCPAGGMRPKGHENPTLFELYWPKITGALLSEDASAVFDRAAANEYIGFSEEG